MARELRRYRAIFDFTASQAREIDMRQGDTLLVERLEDGQWPYAQNWMHGHNERTGQDGEFPGNWTELVGEFVEDGSPQIPPRVPKRSPNNTGAKQGGRPSFLRATSPNVPSQPLQNDYIPAPVQPIEMRPSPNTGPSIPRRSNRPSSNGQPQIITSPRFLPRIGGDDIYTAVGPAPAMHQSSPMHAHSVSQPVEEAEWYWSNVGRDEVSWILQDAEDGSFLVRDKTGFPGDYTLTLKKDGAIRMIRIFHHRGMYGFSEPFNFTSVTALVQYYREHSLCDYNSQLDICLLYPVSKYEETSDRNMKIEGEVIEELRLAEEEYDVKNNEFQKRSEKFSMQKTKELQMENRRRAQEEIITLWRDQLSTLTSNQSQVLMSDSVLLTKNIQEIDQRMREATEELSIHDKATMMLEEETILLDKEMQEMKPRIYELEQMKAQYMSQLGRMGLKPDEIKRRLFAMKKANRDKEKENVMMKKRRASYVANEEEEEERLARDDVYFDIYGTTQDLIRDDDEDDKDWLITVDRKDSERLLAPCEDGVFLVRPRPAVSPTDSHQFTLCIAFRGEVNHIKVLCEGGTFGFTAGCCHLQTLRDLVRHYQTTSLHQHNPKLTISLTTPYNKWNRTRRH